MNETGKRNFWSVSELTSRIRRTLETQIGNVWIEAEISSASQAQSGHVYLTLKDDHAQIRGIIWRSTLVRLKVEIQSGQKVLCQGNLEVYPPRGEYQLVIDRLEPTGQGALQAAFRELHRRLESEGLFDSRWKKPMPSLPLRMGVVTSPSGAAIHDFLKVLLRRWPQVSVTVIPTSVQGPEAKREIAQAILAANRLADPFDVLVVTRGGGSLEDLWSFNEEVVVRAIFESTIPVVSAVGHEVDVTLADLVADLRAATPTEAAENLVPERRAVDAALEEKRQRLMAALKRSARVKRQLLDSISESRCLRDPFFVTSEGRHVCEQMAHRLDRSLDQMMETKKISLEHLSRSLMSVGPKQVMARGYAAVQSEYGEMIRSIDQLKMGQTVRTTLQQGKFLSSIISLQADEESTPQNHPKKATD